MIIDTNSDVYKGYIKGINAIKEILEYPITRLDLLILYIGEKIQLKKQDRAVIDYESFNKKYLSAILIDIDFVDHNIKDLCI